MTAFPDGGAMDGYRRSEKHDANGIGNAISVRCPDRLWSIVLAGGNGERISADIRQWMGRPIPKQYCAFVGTRSMLQHTLARADALGPREHQLTVVARSHEREARSQLADRPQGTVIVQPANRNTAAGVFLPLTHIYKRDPDATVVIYPSDHFIYPEKSFIELTAHAVAAAEELPHRLVLLGVQAEKIELDYGWIRPGQDLWQSGCYSARAVHQFLEKPSHADAVAVRESGGLWNTMVFAVKARTLWQLGCGCFPEIMSLFERLHGAIGTSREDSVLDSIYAAMPELNFSADLLRPATSRVAVMPMEGILWSDWGRGERIMETLLRIGRQPNFPMILAGRRRPPVEDSGGTIVNFPHDDDAVAFH
jgi:mannose-1-phosphate guanylyltransferase